MTTSNEATFAQNDAAPALGDYPDFMLKEVYEQPRVVADALAGRLDEAAGRLLFAELAEAGLDLAAIRHIYIAACGTSSHAGLIAKRMIESLTTLTAEVQIASEFVFSRPAGANDTLVVAISQSGKTSDTMSAVAEAKRHGAFVIAITNVTDSPITEAADATLYIKADVEVAVPATKSYTAQLTMLSLLALYLGQEQGRLSPAEAAARYAELQAVAPLLEQVLEPASVAAIEQAAEAVAQASDVLFIGRGLGVATCYEGALKLKETSYLHAEAFPALEFKHGPIALIDPAQATPVVALLAGGPGGQEDDIYEVAAECKAYGATLVALALAGDGRAAELTDQVIWLPAASEWQLPFVAIVALQLFARRIAQLKGRDIDNPRYLSKAVVKQP